MPQIKKEIQSISADSVLWADLDDFIKKWKADKIQLSDSERLALIQMVVQSPRNGKLHPYLANWFGILFTRNPDFTLSALQFILNKWSPKKEKSHRAGKSWRIQKFLLTHLLFAPIPERPDKKKCFLDLTDCEIAQGYQFDTREEVSVSDVKHARKELVEKINRGRKIKIAQGYQFSSGKKARA